MVSLIRWWEALRAPEVAKWAAEVSSGLGRYRWQEWRSPTNRVGDFDGDGKILLKKQKKKIKERWRWFWTWRRPSSVSASLWSGLGRRISFSQERSCECFAVFFERQRVQFERCAAELPRTITAILPGSKWSCLLLRIVLQDVLSEVIKIYLH